MRAFYEARVEHLGSDDYVLVECVCGHVELTAELIRRAGVAPNELIKGLDRKMRCRECDERGKALLSIKWANAPINPDYPTGRLQ